MVAEVVPLDVRLGLTQPTGTTHTLRWGIIGTGGISSDWAKCLQDVPGAVLQAVAARSLASATEFAATHGVRAALDSYAALVENESVDIVYIGTITPLHKEHVTMAITAGKHVLCEKPLAESASDAEQLYALAKEKGVMLQEGMWTRFFPAVEHARLLIEQGAIGDVVMASADFPDRCYAAQVSPLAFGAAESPTSVVAATRRSDDAGAAVVQYGEKGTTVLSFPPWTSEFQEAMQLTGTKGRITLDGYGHAPTRLSLHLIPSGVPPEPQGHTSTSQNGVEPVTIVHTWPVPQPAGYPAPGWHVSTRHVVHLTCPLSCTAECCRSIILRVCVSGSVSVNSTQTRPASFIRQRQSTAALHQGSASAHNTPKTTRCTCCEF